MRFKVQSLNSKVWSPKSVSSFYCVWYKFEKSSNSCQILKNYIKSATSHSVMEVLSNLSETHFSTPYNLALYHWLTIWSLYIELNRNVFHYRSLSSPAAAAAAAAAGLLPPGLEALYRQAGFPTAFLGLGAGGVPPAGAGGTAPGGGLNPGSSNATPLSVSNSSSTTTTSPYAHVGLQSHANNPNCK